MGLYLTPSPGDLSKIKICAVRLISFWFRFVLLLGARCISYKISPNQ